MATKRNAQMRKDVFIDGVPTPATIDRMYRRYVNQYEAAKMKNERRGDPMFIKRYNREEFENYYFSVYNEMRDEGVVGNAAVADKIIKDMVEEERYEYSARQTAALTKGLNSIGIGAQAQSVRSGRYDDDIKRLYEMIGDRREELAAEGVSAETIRKIIAMDFFGSPE